MRIFFSLLFILIGVIITIKAHWIVSNFGTVAFGEKYLGSSTLFWKLFGILVSFVAILTMIGGTDAFLLWVFGMIGPK